MVKMSDPFTLAYQGIADLLNLHEPLQKYVRLSNSVFWTDDRQRRRQVRSRQDAGLPELELLPAGKPNIQPWQTSTSAAVDQVFMIEVATGKQRIDKAMFPIQFELLRALAVGSPDYFVNDAWLGLKFVTDVRVISAEESDDDPETAKGRRGFSTVLSILVRMTLDRKTVLLADEPSLPEQASDRRDPGDLPK